MGQPRVPNAWGARPRHTMAGAQAILGAMKLPWTRGPSNNGWYGGIGSKPAQTVWTPRRTSSPATQARHHPWRSVRVRRTRRFRMERTPLPVLLAIGVVAGYILYVIVASL